MSIASRIQEIETHIGDVYDTINYSYDTTGVNKNIINIPKYLKKGYIDIINNGIDNLYNNFPKVSEIGSNLSLTPTYEAPMKLNEIQGDTLQDGTPTPDTPVEIQNVTGLQNINITGKNLFNTLNRNTLWKTTEVSKTNNELVLKPAENGGGYVQYQINNIKANTQYTISCNINLDGITGTFKGQVYVYEFNASGTQHFVATMNNENLKRTFTTQSDTKYLRFSFYVLTGSDDNWENIQVTYSNIKLEQGSTVTEYEPYKGKNYEVNLGKNLLDIATLQNGYVTSSGTINTSHPLGEMYSEFIKVQPNTTYTFKIFETGSAYDNWIGIGKYTANNLSSFIQRIAMATTTQNYYTFTTSATTQYIIVSARNLAQATKIQLEKGSQVTSYTPYFTPIELNKIGDYKDSIKKSTGKNLFDKSTITTGQYIDASGNLVNDNSNFVGDYISINNTKSYYASQNAGGVIRIGYYDSNKTFISRQLISANYGSLTIPNNAVYVRLSCYNQSLDTLQLELGTQQTSYEPYGKVWYVEKNIGKVVLDGSTGSYSNVSTNRFNIDNLITDFKKSEGYNLSLSNYYKSFNQVGSNAEFNTLVSNENYAFDFSSATSYTLRFKDTRYTNVNDFKTWLGTNNVSIIYVLNTPTYTEITNTELIEELEALYTAKSQEGTTNISITSEDLEMILNVSALKGEE